MCCSAQHRGTKYEHHTLHRGVCRHIAPFSLTPGQSWKADLEEIQPRLAAGLGPDSSCRVRGRPPLSLAEQSGPRGGSREKCLRGGCHEFTLLGRKGKG